MGLIVSCSYSLGHKKAIQENEKLLEKLERYEFLNEENERFLTEAMLKYDDLQHKWRKIKKIVNDGGSGENKRV